MKCPECGCKECCGAGLYQELEAIYQIRQIVEDKPGTMMLDELVERVRELKEAEDER